MNSIRDTWRAAALRDQLQFYGWGDRKSGLNRPVRPDDERAMCGLTALTREQKEPIYKLGELVCPECGESAWGVMLISHLNDAHFWGFLDLANKFPPVLPEDMP